MPEQYSIGELSRAAGVPTSSVRYYERAGLLEPSARTASNYRVYQERSLERLRFIKAAQATGFTLDDVRLLLELADGDTVPCREVQDVIEARLGEVSRRMKDLRSVQSVLKVSLEACREAEATGRCDVLERLEAISTGQTTPRRRKGRL